MVPENGVSAVAWKAEFRCNESEEKEEKKTSGVLERLPPDSW